MSTTHLLWIKKYTGVYESNQFSDKQTFALLELHQQQTNEKYLTEQVQTKTQAALDWCCSIDILSNFLKRRTGFVKLLIKIFPRLK